MVHRQQGWQSACICLEAGVTRQRDIALQLRICAWRGLTIFALPLKLRVRI